jgi:hypothetical protein
MRSLPAILLATLTALVIAVSVVVTVSHFGMRDWPTPPMPDTATRLITPTEAAEHVRQRMSDADDPVEVKPVGDADSAAPPPERSERLRARTSARSGGTHVRRGAARRGSRSGARRRAGSNPTPPAQTSQDDPTTPAPADGAAAPQAPAPQPVTQASSGDQAQARQDDSPASSPAPSPDPAPVTPPALPIDPVVPDLPVDDGGDDEDQDHGREHGHGHGHAPVRNLLDQPR